MKPHARFVTVAGVLIAGALLMACTMIGHERVAGWPALLIVEHERLHCEGYDHVGSSHLQRLLSGFLQAEESSASAGASQEER